MALLLDILASGLAAGCCPAKVYALVFDHQGNALKDNGSGTLVLAPYIKANHADFAQVLVEATERTSYYTKNVTLVTFPVTPDGAKYTVEYRYRNAPGTAYNRDQDAVLELRDLYWSGTNIQPTRLDLWQEGRLQFTECHVTVGYDSTTKTVYAIAWMEKNFSPQLTTTRCEFQWINYLGVEICHVIVTSVVPGVPGVFRFSLPNTDLTPDQVGVVKATIRDADGVDHLGIYGTNTWD